AALYPPSLHDALPIFYALPVRLPPLAEQRSIAALLASLDDKIELNRQINNTLDALGQTVFRSWFTDFDPVSPTLPGMTPRGASRSEEHTSELQSLAYL